MNSDTLSYESDQEEKDLRKTFAQKSWRKYFTPEEIGEVYNRNINESESDSDSDGSSDDSHKSQELLKEMKNSFEGKKIAELVKQFYQPKEIHRINISFDEEPEKQNKKIINFTKRMSNLITRKLPSHLINMEYSVLMRPDKLSKNSALKNARSLSKLR